MKIIYRIMLLYESFLQATVVAYISQMTISKQSAIQIVWIKRSTFFLKAKLHTLLIYFSGWIILIRFCNENMKISSNSPIKSMLLVKHYYFGNRTLKWKYCQNVWTNENFPEKNIFLHRFLIYLFLFIHSSHFNVLFPK